MHPMIPVSATRYHWTLYVDPITSLILTLLILMTTLKVLKVPIMILLQTVPKNINLKKLRIVHKMMHFFSPSHWLRPQWSLHRFVDFYSDELIHLCRASYEVRTDLTFDRPQMTFRPQTDLLKWTFKAEVNIHNLHVWTLTGNKVVGTVHIKLINETDQAVQIEKFNKVNIIYSCK